MRESLPPLQHISPILNTIELSVMASITSARREILLDPIGTNVWSGATVQSLNSAAVTWSLAGQLYGRHGPYKWIPIGLALGMIPTTIQYFLWKVSLLLSITYRVGFDVQVAIEMA